MDRLLRFIKDIRQATFFDIQNVADYYFTYPEDKWQSGRDFTLAPPFDFFATRYTMPTKNYPAELAGLEMLTVFRTVSYAPTTDMQIMGDEINPYPPVLVPDARWHILAQLFSAEGRQVSPPSDWFFAVYENGQMATYRDHLALWVTNTHNPGNQVMILADSFIQVSFLALTFLHTKNVEIITPPPPTKKRLPRKVKFESRYHRLKVNAIGTKRESRGAGKQTGISQALHIVRGHFREYGPEFGKGKLFGKYTGRYLVAGHFKGDLEIGAVAKDYEVNAP